MKEIIYCVEILKQKHELLKKDRDFFFKIQSFEECAFIRNNEKQIEIIVKKLLEECKVIIVNSGNDVNNEEVNHYNTLLSYFNLDYDKSKAKLENQLSTQKKKLKSLLAIFNFRVANQIREEIKETEKELIKINALLKGERL